MPMQPSAANRVKYSQMKLRGGLDLTTPVFDLPSGFLRSSENFEVSETGGYRRIDGYERFDGRPSPSAASFGVVQFTTFTNVPTVGQTLTDGVTGATGVIATVVDSGLKYVIITKVVGAHTVGNAQAVGATPIGTMITQTLEVTPELFAIYSADAAEIYRDDITGPDPTGIGAVLGVATLVIDGVDHTYAFRSNAAGTIANLWEATTSGWVQVPYFREVSFTLGLGTGAGNLTPPVEGETITETAGGEVATIMRVCHQSGSWGSTTAAGRLIVTTPAASEFEGGAATFSGGATCTLSGPSTAIAPVVTNPTTSEIAKYEMFVWNFSGQASGIRIYGCDGANRMFEFDGETYVPITTGTTPDIPSHIGVLANHLFGGFKSSAIHSVPGLPFNWTAGSGLGSEIATGDTITGFMSVQGSQTAPALAIYGTRQSSMLYGTGTASWTLSRFDTGVGAVDYSVQRLDDVYAIDDSGVTKLKAVQDFGNFAANSLTQNIMPFIRTVRTQVANSTISRDKSQYRIFFDDKTALYLTVVNGRYLGSGIQRFQHTVWCTSNADNARVNGDPDVFIGTTDGLVMKLDSGPSFDGSEINAFMETNWDTMGKPRITKRMLKAALEVQSTSYVSLSFGYTLGYGLPSIKQPDVRTYVSRFNSTNWDSFVWDNFTWDGTLFDAPLELELKGRAETIRYRISTASNYISSYTINSVITHYEDGKPLR